MGMIIKNCIILSTFHPIMPKLMSLCNLKTAEEQWQTLPKRKLRQLWIVLSPSCFVPPSSHSVATVAGFHSVYWCKSSHLVHRMVSTCTDMLSYSVHSKITWFHFRAAPKNPLLPFSGAFTEFLTKQFKSVGKTYWITAADPRWALALFHLLPSPWFISHTHIHTFTLTTLLEINNNFTSEYLFQRNMLLNHAMSVS